MTALATGTQDHAWEAEPQIEPRSLLLVNPRSFRMASRNRLQRIDQFAQSRRIPLYAVHGPEEIAAALADAAPGPDDRLIIIGGDGTLQAAVSELAPAAEKRLAPRLCMLGGGRTNFTARDLGSHRRLLGSLEHLLAEPAAWKATDRAVLRLSSDRQEPLYGFFIAGALVDAVIRDCHAYRARGVGWLRTGQIATPWRLTQLAWLTASGRKRFPAPALELNAEGLGTLSGPIRILLMTSLQHESGLLNPYAARGEGPLRLTAVHAQAPAFWRSLPRLLSGRFGPKQCPDQGYLSGSARAVTLSGLSSICLDGQEYSLDPGCELRVEAGPAFRFLHP